MFLADLHIHSKFSRATSKNMDLEHLFIAAQQKGVSVVGTGDFTHPGWFAEIREKLIPAEPGLYALRPDIAAVCRRQVPASCRKPVRFLLTAEISSIYKKKGRTRKNHNLVFVENRSTAAELNRRLDRIGNIRSDGRPILGLDARVLLEMLLSISDSAFLVPAHIWTPWFSLFGSKSGFDSIQECFEDLADEIFAVETGLSSDPPMNWQVADLDGRSLVSNSDAHSPGKLAREATLFAGDMDYSNLRQALKEGDPRRLVGTVEFYPEEGKYHYDGHRKCGVRLSPEQSRQQSGQCPRCGRPLTLGVLFRVQQLADPTPGRRPPSAREFISLVPLEDILSELLEVGPQSKRVRQAAQGLLGRFGSEFDILHRTSAERLDHTAIPLLGEAVRRMRKRAIRVEPGYDGQYGKVRIFDSGERRQLMGQTGLFPAGGPSSSHPAAGPEPVSSRPQRLPKKAAAGPTPDEDDGPFVLQLNSDQQEAERCRDAALLVVAGPGTGKTRTLICRMVHMIRRRSVAGDRILALTFTNQAAAEMAQRLRQAGTGGPPPTVATIHSLCLSLLQQHGCLTEALVDEEQSRLVLADAVRSAKKDGIPVTEKTSTLANRVAAAKHAMMPEEAATASDPDPALNEVLRRYQDLMKIQGLVDYEDLIVRTRLRMHADAGFCSAVHDRYRHVLIDEYQDLNPGQYRLIRMLMPEVGAGRSITAIGDPNQSIYGFRGSDPSFFHRFTTDYPGARVVVLTRNYRSVETVLRASGQVLGSGDGRIPPVVSGIESAAGIGLLCCPSEKAEAVAAGRMIEAEVGGTGFHAVDFGKVDAARSDERSFADFAVLVRTVRQMGIFEEVLTDAGIPVRPVRKPGAKSDVIARLLALVRLIAGRPTHADIQRGLPLLAPGIGRPALAAFRDWALAGRLSAGEALRRIRVFPVPGLARNRQQLLCEACRRLSALSERPDRSRAADLLPAVAEAVGITEDIRLDAVASGLFDRLIEEAEHTGASVEEMLHRFALKTDADTFDPRAEAVVLMTLHGAKGLEFPVVWIAGCEEGLIPLASEDGTVADRSEERRLLYVGMTRARERLFLSWSRRRRHFGRTETRRLSSFAEAIEAGLLETTALENGAVRRSGPRQLELFE